MPTITLLPHPDTCPNGLTMQAETGVTVCKTLLANHIHIEHACEMVCACTTCHVIVRNGLNSLNDLSEDEEDMLDKAWGLHPNSRLACQARVGTADIIIEIPKYSINHAKEG